MTDYNRKEEEMLKRVSRRYMVRNAAIAATGALLLPSFMTSCRKDRDLSPGPGGGLGGQELTPEQLKTAAQNLINMDKWVENVYLYTGNYEQYVFSLINSGQKPSSWKDFIIDILLDIATGLFEAAGAEIPGIGAALAIAAESVKAWTADNHPDNLEATFAEFKDAHLAMQKAISDQLIVLAGPDNNYQALREGFAQPLDFNDKTYTLNDLANSHFPTPEDGQSYVDLRNAGYDKFRKHMWNVMMIKCGNMVDVSYESVDAESPTPTQYAQSLYKTKHQASYLRGYYKDNGISAGVIYLYYYNFQFDNKNLSADAAKELFKDDTPGNIINPKGLFNRDYVFKQFHTKAPVFTLGKYDLTQNDDKWPDPPPDKISWGFNPDTDFEFTGGDFPQLIEP